MSEGIAKAIEYHMLCSMESLLDLVITALELCDVGEETPVTDTLGKLFDMMKDAISYGFELLDRGCTARD